jgi:predicted regulator of Ras-like GTPase activity (Roadblock/LC7/MglB family)
MDHKTLKLIFSNFIKQIGFAKAINLSTVDGFTILSHTAANYQIENDKLSAVSSSLISLSNAASKQLINSQLVNTVIETVDGTMIILKTKYKNKLCVLCVITDIELNVGKSRYFSIKLAESIATIPVSK